jgi:hypothetical protein
MKGQVNVIPRLMIKTNESFVSGACRVLFACPVVVRSQSPANTCMDDKRESIAVFVSKQPVKEQEV